MASVVWRGGVAHPTAWDPAAWRRVEKLLPESESPCLSSWATGRDGACLTTRTGASLREWSVLRTNAAGIHVSNVRGDMRTGFCAFFLTGLAMTFSGAALAEDQPMARNHVTVESKTVCTGQKDAIVRVLVENELEIRHITVPLVIRSAEGGAFINRIQQTWGDRLPAGKNAPLGEYAITTLYSQRECECMKPGEPGFGPDFARDTLPHPVEGSPIAVMATRLRIFGENLKPGQDSTGSIILTMGITDVEGAFEIDTTCVCPGNTLMYVEDSETPQGVYPTFTKGVITVEPCGKQ